MVLMSGQTEKVEYDYLADAPRPEEVTFPPPSTTGDNRSRRRFFPWQVVRLFVLNLKINEIIIGGHS